MCGVFFFALACGGEAVVLCARWKYPHFYIESSNVSPGKVFGLALFEFPGWVVSSDAYSLASTVMRRQAVFGLRNR
jgi:hypothetical protein